MSKVMIGSTRGARSWWCRSRARSGRGWLGALAAEIGRGLVAGLVGTAAMTVSSTIEMRLRMRPSSRIPAEAAKKVLKLAPRRSRDDQRLASVVHWSYGTAWGLMRAALGLVGLCRAGAPLAHLGAVWGASLVMLPALKLAPPVHRWPRAEIGIDLLHHAVYAAAADAAYRALSRRPA